MFPGVWKPLFLRVSSRDRIPFPGRSSLPTSFVSFFVLLYFFLPVFEANDLLCWVPDVLCQHSEVVLWNLLSVEMFFWWIFEGESGLPILFLRHLRTALVLSFDILCFIIPRKIKMQLKCRKKKSFSVYGERAKTDWTCQRWFVRFCARDFMLDNVLQSGRPVEVDSNQIEALIENDQYYIMPEIADILKISKSIFENHFHQLDYDSIKTCRSSWTMGQISGLCFQLDWWLWRSPYIISALWYYMYKSDETWFKDLLIFKVKV